MKVRLLALVVFVALCAIFVSVTSLGAAPLPGASRDSMTLPSAPTYLDTSVCPSFPTPRALDVRLDAVISGWYGPVFDSFFQQVQLAAEVSGTVTTSSGATYHASGHFVDNGVYSLLVQDLRFEGAGMLVLSGPDGLMLGHATLRAVTAPNELQITFTSAAVCRPH
jgi:hypothetical protein